MLRAAWIELEGGGMGFMHLLNGGPVSSQKAAPPARLSEAVSLQ